MKRRGSGWASWLVCSAALVLLSWLQDRSPPAPIRPETPGPPRLSGPLRTRPSASPLPAPEPSPVTTPAPLPEYYLPRAGAKRTFGRGENTWAYTLSYGFVDHHGRPHQVSCDVSRADHEWQVRSFGLDRQQMEPLVDARLQELADEEIAARRISGDVRFHAQGMRWEATATLPESLPDQERARRAARVDDFMRWVREDMPRKAEVVLGAVLSRGALRFERGVVEPDHAVVATRASRALAGCFDALARSGQGYGERQLLGLFVAFMQEIPYVVPQRAQGPETFGLLVPTAVLVEDRGDCDSKAVAFAALWRNLDQPLLLVLVPGHMLVGVAVPPGPGERYVQLGLRYFVLCEVAGPSKPHPGLATVPERFEYVLIEPAASGRPAVRGRSPG